jgi:hypothetical protein
MKERPTEVVVTDVNMRFGSMVAFMVKWVLASIPALFILVLIGVSLAAFVQSCVEPFTPPR